MPTLVLESFPEGLRTRLELAAAAQRRTITQETIHLLEKALNSSAASTQPGKSYWADRPLLPEYVEAIEAGAFSEGPDSTQIISEERDAR